ncbi:MAG: LptF/LptG family permease [Planctomycetota bacterium]
MWRIYRYYTREVIVNTALTFTVLFGIVLIASVSRGIRRAEGFGLIDAAKVTLLWAADSLTHLLPIALLFGSVLTFARASQARELIAFQAAGVNTRVPMRAALVVGCLGSLLTFWVLHWEIPKTHFWKTRIITENIRAVLLQSNVNGDSVRQDSMVLTWDGRSEDGAFEDLVLFVVEPLPELQQLQIAKEGIFLANSVRVSAIDEGATLSVEFENLHDPINGVALANPILRQDLESIASRARRLEGAEDLSSDQLICEVLRDIHPEPLEARFQVNRRSAFSLLPLLLAPIGFCIGHLSRDRGRVVALALAGVPLGIFYASDFIGAKLTFATQNPIFGWSSVIGLGLASSPLMWRVFRT